MRCSCDIGAYTDAEGYSSGVHIHQLDIGSSLCMGAFTQRMLGVIQNLYMHIGGVFDGCTRRIDRAVSDALCR